jgi:hypothetical protein
LGLIEQASDVICHQLSGIEVNADLIGRLFETAQSIIHFAFASGPIVRSLEKSIGKTYTKLIAAILDLLK